MGHHTWCLWWHLHNISVYSIPVGWCRNQIVCGARSVAIDPSGWRVFQILASPIPLHLEAGRFRLSSYYFFQSQFGNESRLSSGVCPLIFTSGCPLILLCLQSMTTLKSSANLHFTFSLFDAFQLLTSLEKAKSWKVNSIFVAQPNLALDLVCLQNWFK